MPRRILFHPDPERLEEELALAIRGIKSEAGPWARVLVAVPTQRLVRRLRERLAAREQALIGVEILQYQALAYRLMESSESAPPSLLGERALDRLLAHVLEHHPNFSLAAYARARPGALSELRARLEELREAGVGAGDIVSGAPSLSEQTLLFAEAGSDTDPLARELSLLLDAFDRALETLEARGWTDRPGLARRAARSSLFEFEAVFAYGAYEIVGAHLELLSALRARRPLTIFVPADLDAPAWAHARDQARRFFQGELEAISDGASGARDFVLAARCLHDGEALPPSDLPRITLAHAQGPEAELTLVVRRALALVGNGVPPSEIAIVARTLEPYAAIAETVFARHRLPVDASATLPLSRNPEPRALLLLLRALSRKFERRAVIELARSHNLAHPDWARQNPLWRASAWERWSRAYGLIGGLEAWTVELPRLIRERALPPWMEDAAEAAAFRERREEEANSAVLLGRLVAEWAALGERWASCNRASEHILLLDELRRTWIRSVPPHGPEHAALDRVWNGALEQLGALEAVLDPSPLDRDTVLEFLTDTLETASLPFATEEGVAFLDLRQARGLAFRHVFFMGMNDGLYPKPPRDTPLLPDRIRRAIRDRTGKPLAVRREARGEERLLFAELVASTCESLAVTWQRADAEGRALAPSLVLRELGRILPGSPSLSGLLVDAPSGPAALPTEPTLAAEWLERETGLLLREEAALLSARNAASTFLGLRGFLEVAEPPLGRDLAAGLALIEATESGNDLRFDGAILPVPPARPFSASSLEQLARCPLTFFFKHVLGVRPLDEEAREYRMEAREIGALVHRILETVYRDLAPLLNGKTSAPELQAAGRAALAAHLETELSPLASRMNRSYPLLYATTAAIWKEELERFLDKDLARLAEGGHTLDSLESVWSERIALGHDRDNLFLTGLPDRVTRDREGRLWISDYKTSGRLEKFTDPNRYLTGEYLQLPLYVLMAMGRQGSPTPMPEAEIIGLGPHFFPNYGFVGGDANRFDSDTFSEVAAGFSETLSVLEHLVAAGRFPFRSAHHCRWCHFHLACRRHQLSTESRVVEHPDHDVYFRMKDKTKKNSLLGAS